MTPEIGFKTYKKGKKWYYLTIKNVYGSNFVVVSFQTCKSHAEQTSIETGKYVELWQEWW